MSLNKEDLRSNLLTLLEDMLTREDTSIVEFAQRLADILDAYVRTGTAIGTDSHGDTHELSIE